MAPTPQFLIEQGIRWIHEQRTLHRPEAEPLSSADAAMFAPFFSEAILSDARFRAVPAIDNPPFYEDLKSAGLTVPMEFSTAHGITFDDTVLLAAASLTPNGAPQRLLFHEMVHVVQYRLLGIEEFARRYVTGWAENGFDYYRIPLERDAYELDARFDADPTSGFSVEAEVGRRLGL